jgi:hypothetical protein
VASPVASHHYWPKQRKNTVRKNALKEKLEKKLQIYYFATSRKIMDSAAGVYQNLKTGDKVSHVGIFDPAFL